MTYATAKTITNTNCVAIGVFKNKTFSAPAGLNEVQQKSIAAVMAHGDFSAKIGQIFLRYKLEGFDAARVVLFGLGEQEKYNLSSMQKTMQALGKFLTETALPNLDILLPKINAADDIIFTRQAIIALEDANMRRDQLKTKQTDMFWPETITFISDSAMAEQGKTQGEAIAQAIKLTKELANLPSNHCTPTILADRAAEMAKAQPKLTAEIFDEKAIKELKMGGLLAIAQGSVQPPRMIVLHYKGAADDQAPVVLVGKGVTFDTGGICLKPGPRMDEMKYDMCGAATVIGVMQAVAALNLPINVVGIAVATENMPSGSACKPGDVFTTMSGKTIEILNTDAEGRVILCDALTYAERFNPKAVIDIATLTGAIIITLGSQTNGLMANNEELAQKLLAAGMATGDRAWQLPIWDEYQELTDSAFADVANLGNDEAKSITAACFLARFAEKYPWAHLDIAGTAWRGGGNMNRAATGRPIPLLMQYLLQQ